MGPERTLVEAPVERSRRETRRNRKKNSGKRDKRRFNINYVPKQ